MWERVDKEMQELTEIGNKLMIRHTEVRKTPITKSDHVAVGQATVAASYETRPGQPPKDQILRPPEIILVDSALLFQGCPAAEQTIRRHAAWWSFLQHENQPGQIVVTTRHRESATVRAEASARDVGRGPRLFSVDEGRPTARIKSSGSPKSAMTRASAASSNYWMPIEPGLLRVCVKRRLTPRYGKSKLSWNSPADGRFSNDD